MNTESQLDRRADQKLLLAVALTPALLLLFALVAFFFDEELGTSIFGIHVVAQFIVLVAYAALLSTDTPLGGIGRAIWAFAFLFAAPVALPLYWWVRVRHPVETPHFEVTEVDLDRRRGLPGTLLSPAGTAR